MIAFVNGNFIEEENAVLQIGDLALQRGYAAFDYLRTGATSPLFLDSYIDRFFYSAAHLFLKPEQSKEEVKGLILELIKRNKKGQSGIRMIFTGGYAPDSYTPVKPNLIITQQPLQLPSEETFQKGVKVISHQYQRDLPHLKSINYLMGIYLQKEAKAKAAQDVLYYNNGFVSEFPRANVFVVTGDGTLVTPAENILHGITRAKLIELAAGRMRVEQRALSIEEVKASPEVFMTSTTKRLLPVTQIDDTIIGTGGAGPVTVALYKAFVEMEKSVATVQ